MVLAKIDVVNVVVLYEKNSGLIRHTHYEAVPQGAKEIKMRTKEMAEELALKLAKEKGLDTSQLAVLHVTGSDVKRPPGMGLSVDLKTKKLVEHELRKKP